MPLQSFRTLPQDPATVQRNLCHAKGQEGPRRPEFELDIRPSGEQARAIELLQAIEA